MIVQLERDLSLPGEWLVASGDLGARDTGGRARGVPWYVPRLVPLLYARQAAVRQAARRLLAWLGARDCANAAGVVRHLLPLIYAEGAEKAGTARELLAELTDAYPAAVGVLDWRWRVQVLCGLPAGAERTAAAARLGPRRRHPVPVREAAIWTELSCVGAGLDVA
ncbi:MAG TPA: hypothetical protein VM536_23215 [Chloroflexia bacterium]|nr:hypothetical protein [Chloroflexia bacterium]